MAISLLGASCSYTEKKDPSLPHYNLEKPEKFIMPESLLEISGIAFHQGSPDTVYAIQDEEGKLFRLAWGVKKQYHTKFGKQGDYEDVAILDSQVFVLKSNGTLYSFPFADAIFVEADNVREYKNLIPKEEYEAMYADAATGNLYVICKNCSADNSKAAVTGYVLHAGDTAYLKNTFTLDVNEIKNITGKVKRGFRPSGLAKNPLTGEWFIISAVNQLLVVADSNWKIKEAYHLNNNVFNQPEGIAFDKAGNLYISNEGDDLTAGNILKFVRDQR